MDELIIEALEYVTPKKVDEAAAIEASKKAPAKKPAPNETQKPTDIFEGRNTTEYKKIAGLIKSQFFPDFEGEFVTKIDLINQVLDEQLLVDLFTERLKLEFEDKIKKPDLKQGCLREIEILKQLKDLEEKEASAPNLADKASKGKAPAKTAAKGPEEQLKEELEAIRKMDVNGWILVGFPKTLTQAKLLEKALSGYELKSDIPKSKKLSLFDSWSKVSYPASLVGDEKEPDVAASALDGILFM